MQQVELYSTIRKSGNESHGYGIVIAKILKLNLCNSQTKQKHEAHLRAGCDWDYNDYYCFSLLYL